jgi:hypothetical protein
MDSIVHGWTALCGKKRITTGRGGIPVKPHMVYKMSKDIVYIFRNAK